MALLPPRRHLPRDRGPAQSPRPGHGRRAVASHQLSVLARWTPTSSSAATPHGRQRYVVQAALRLKPMVVVLLGDIEASRPLQLELESNRELVWWLQSNHDTDRAESWRNLVDSELADRSLDGRVVTLADGTRLVGLGGVFRQSVWMPPGPGVHETYDAWLASCQWWRAPVRDTEKLQHRSSVDDAACGNPCHHEAGSSHPHGHAAIDELVQSMGVQASFHGHHHDSLDYSGRWTALGLKAFGVGLGVHPIAYKARSRRRALAEQQARPRTRNGGRKRGASRKSASGRQRPNQRPPPSGSPPTFTSA